MDNTQFDGLIENIRKKATAKGGYILHNQINDLLGDETDVDLLTLNWGSAAHPAYDLDGNGLIGLGDAAIIRANWDPNPGVAGSVPEPGSLALLTIGSLALLVLRRRCRI